MAGLEKSAKKNINLLNLLSKEASENEGLENLILQEKLDELADLDLDLDGNVEEDIGNISDKERKKLELEADKFLAEHPEEAEHLKENDYDIYDLEEEKTRFNPEENTLGEDVEDLMNERLDMQNFDEKYKELENLTNLTSPEKNLYRGRLYGPEYFSEERMNDLNEEIQRAKQRKAATQKITNKIAGFEEWHDNDGLFSEKDFQTIENDEIPEVAGSKIRKPIINPFKNKTKRTGLLRDILHETPENTEKDFGYENIEKKLEDEDEDDNFVNDSGEACGTCGYDHELEYALLTEDKLRSALQSHKDAGDYDALGMQVPDFLLEDENNISDNLWNATKELLKKKWTNPITNKEESIGEDPKIRNKRRLLQRTEYDDVFPEENDDELNDFTFNHFDPENERFKKYIPEDVSDKPTDVSKLKFEKPNYDWEPEDPHITRRDTFLLMPKSPPIPYDLDEEEMVQTERKPNLIDDMKAANKKLDQMLKVLATNIKNEK
jgi:hypothetical protein